MKRRLLSDAPRCGVTCDVTNHVDAQICSVFENWTDTTIPEVARHPVRRPHCNIRRNGDERLFAYP
jgi:hypothetical protein